jgi:GNAT superfamily N-acetyltransferase
MKVIYSPWLNDEQKSAVLKLWNQEYPDQLQYKTRDDLDSYLSHLQDAAHFLYTGSSNEVLGWAFKFSRESARWFAVILDSSIHKKGIGTLLLNKLKDQETELHGWVVDHDSYLKSDAQVYFSPLAFYLKNEFKVIEGVRLESPLLSAAKIIWRSGLL